MVDLEQLLYDDGLTMQQVAEFFRHRDFPDEAYLVQAIRKYLVDDAVRAVMHQHNFSFEDMLNGRCSEEQSGAARQLFEQWNNQLGFVYFRS